MRTFGLFLLLLHLASADDNSDGRGLDSDRTVKHVEKNNDIVVSNNLETRSRLILLNGNMHFRAGIRRNITFDVGDDGGIFFHNLNILDIPSR
uniref:LAM_G_DOMAIN domain-containing protein n=2 Tax=Bursaphelenchus xylophilus TaxID=6326 RepID=A0A1I7SJF7_BURXY